jgi:hypothetical protein
MAAYEQAEQAGVFTEYVSRITLAPEASIIWDVETNVWEEKLSVAFSRSPYNRMEQQGSGVVAMVTLDLATGEMVDTDYLRDLLPENWVEQAWFTRFNENWYGEYDGDYSPPANSELKHFRKTFYGNLLFDVCQPDGEIVAAAYYLFN